MDGSGSGSATVGQLEVHTLTHQLELLSHLCNKVIVSSCALILSYAIHCYPYGCVTKIERVLNV